MGKVVKFTGSLVLGAELRRLRGDRRQEDIVALSKSSPYSDRCRSISAPSLSQIESGQTLPALDTLFTLSNIYQVPVQHFLDLIVEERLSLRDRMPSNLDATRRESVDAFSREQWHEAMALAVHGEREAATHEERIRWSAYRACCLARANMRRDATELLLDCAHAPDVSRATRSQVHALLADVLAASGHVVHAAESARQALLLLPEDAAGSERLPLLVMRASLLLGCREDLLDVTERALREVLELVEEARPLVTEGDHEQRLLLDLLHSTTWRYLGNEILAAEQAKTVIAESVKVGARQAELHGLVHLASLRKSQGRVDEARELFGKAELRATELDDADQAFDCTYELLMLVREGDVAARSRLRRRCHRFYARIRTRSRHVLAFEASRRSAGP